MVSACFSIRWSILSFLIMIHTLQRSSNAFHLVSYGWGTNSRSLPFKSSLPPYYESDASPGTVSSHSCNINRCIPPPFQMSLPSHSFSSRSSSVVLSAKAWSRLGVEDDTEPYWYIINCQAGLEQDLLRQCREKLNDHPDVVKFIVPTTRLTRSHGANKMVTETKVKYLGYVFAKLRLCEDIYEAIQELDHCRSWMGTVNHKGYRKLPPVPLALNEEEVKSFGLEEWVDEDEFDSNSKNTESVDDDQANVIVDLADDDEVKSKVDETAVKAFLGLKVEDMVKVTAKGKFFNEDGIVRRLKDGKIMVRFFTYGSMYDEWMSPSDVRKLTELEILRGLSGPSKPITQEDWDNRSRDRSDTGRAYDNRRRDPINAAPQRNRRQDRIADRYSSRNADDSNSNNNWNERNRNDRNWNWYQDQQQQKRQEGAPVKATDGRYNIQAGSYREPRRGSDWALGDVDSQWGRGKAASQGDRRIDSLAVRGDRRMQQKPFNDRANPRDRQQIRQNEAAIYGGEDWSSFLTPASSLQKRSDTKANPDEDFFSSLMDELSTELDKTKSIDSGSSGNLRNSKKNQSNNMNPPQSYDSSISPISFTDPRTSQRSKISINNPNEDFFTALEMEMETTMRQDATPSTRGKNDAKYSDPMQSSSRDASNVRTSSTGPSKKQGKNTPGKNTNNSEDDFFTALEKELESTLRQDAGSTTRGKTTAAADDFFAMLEAELSLSSPSSNAPRDRIDKTSASNPTSNLDDFLSEMYSEFETQTPPSQPETKSPGASSSRQGKKKLEKSFPTPDSTTIPREEILAPERSSTESSSSKGSSPATGGKQSRSVDAGSLETYTLPVLKDMLRERGLKVSGKKSDLIERLLQSS